MATNDYYNPNYNGYYNTSNDYFTITTNASASSSTIYFVVDYNVEEAAGQIVDVRTPKQQREDQFEELVEKFFVSLGYEDDDTPNAYEDMLEEYDGDPDDGFDDDDFDDEEEWDLPDAALREMTDAFMFLRQWSITNPNKTDLRYAEFPNY